MAVRVGRHRVRVIASCVVGALVLLVVLAQVFLPSLAAQQVRDRVARYGTVHSVSVSAFPAVELLWGKAGTVNVSAGTLSTPVDRIAALLGEVRGVTNVTFTANVSTLTGISALSQGVTVHDLRIEKRGTAVSASATLTQQQLNEALPSGFRVEPTASGGGEVEALASGGLFGIQASINVLVHPQEGRLVAEPKGFPLASLATVTLFSNPQLNVDSVGARVLRKEPLTYRLSFSGSLA
jgi:hypothetical protein